MDSQKTKTLGIVLILFLLLLFYKCPIQSVTGLPCPGCNMKTSLYYLVHFKFSLSLYYHALLIPTLIVIVVVLMNLNKPERIKKLLIIWAILMIVYYIYRMIVYFPDSPMMYSKENLIYQKEDKKMSNIFFTMTGLNHYYGNGRLSKER